MHAVTMLLPLPLGGQLQQERRIASVGTHLTIAAAQCSFPLQRRVTVTVAYSDCSAPSITSAFVPTAIMGALDVSTSPGSSLSSPSSRLLSDIPELYLALPFRAVEQSRSRKPDGYLREGCIVQVLVRVRLQRLYCNRPAEPNRKEANPCM